MNQQFAVDAVTDGSGGGLSLLLPLEKHGLRQRPLQGVEVFLPGEGWLLVVIGEQLRGQHLPPASAQHWPT